VNIYRDSLPQNDFFSSNSDDDLLVLAFSDRQFPAGEVKQEVKLNALTSDTLVATVTNISKAFFEYIESRGRSNSSFLSEPVSFPSNVVNGLGYFNLHFPSVRVIEVEK